MGLLKKHKGAERKTVFTLHFHALSPWPKGAGLLAIQFSRGKREGGTRPVAPVAQAGAGFATYTFEQAVELPVTLYQDAAHRGKLGAPSYERKELELRVARGGGGGASPLGTVALDLAAYAGERRQSSFSVSCDSSVYKAVGTPKLLVTIVCRDAGALAVAVAPLASSAEEAAAASAGERPPTSLSTDDEGGSRPSSRGGDGASRLGSAAAGGGKLPPVPEAAAAAHAGGRAGWARAAAAAGPSAAPGLSVDSEGFVKDASLDGEAGEREQQEQEQQPEVATSAAEAASVGSSLDLSSLDPSSARVRRNLGSALQHAEDASEASDARESGAEVQSRAAAPAPARPVGGAEAAVAAAAPLAAPAATAGPGAAAKQQQQQQLLPAEATPAEPRRQQPPSPEPWSTGGQSSAVSAGLDPAMPFTVPPSTQRRTARPEGQPGRRWAWRRDVPTLPPGAPGAQFQRLRLASSNKSEAAAAAAVEVVAAEAAEAPAAGVEQSGLSASSGVSFMTTGTDAEATSSQLRGGSQAQEAANMSAGRDSPAKEPTPFAAAAAALQPGGSRPASAADSERAWRYGSLGPGTAPSLLLPISGASSLDGPAPQASAAQAQAQALVDSLARELRVAAALESAVYLAAGRHAFLRGPPSARQLHAPARRLARTTLGLGGAEGLAFALRAAAAVRAVSGAASGDLHRLSFWWSNVQQLRWTLWASCQSEATLAAAAAGVAAARADGGGACAAPASPRSGRESAWILASLVPQLRELECWLFESMLRHLWRHVLLPAATQAAAAADRGGSRGSSVAAEAAAAQGRPPSVSGSRPATPSSLQGTPRQFETDEEEAVQRWVEALRVAAGAVAEDARPAPAPRPQLLALRRQLLAALLRRLDALLFQRLLAGDGLGPPGQEHGQQAPNGGLGALPPRALSGTGRREVLVLGLLGAGLEPRAGGGYAAEAASEDVLLGRGSWEAELDPSLLPFQRGALTFGTGVSLKMAVARLTSWAADVGVKEERLPERGRSTDAGADYRLFPRLRATADLLMMPKEVLADDDMRHEVVPGLPLRHICRLLERFAPDDSAPEPLPEGLLQALAAGEDESEGEAASPASGAGGGGGSGADGDEQEEDYSLAGEAELLAQGVVQPGSLAPDEGSDEELEGLGREAAAAAAQAAAPGAPLALPPHGVALLRELWSSAW